MILLGFKTSMALTLLVPGMKLEASIGTGKVFKDRSLSSLEKEGGYVSCASTEIYGMPNGAFL